MTPTIKSNIIVKSLDLNNTYYQIPMRESDNEKTAFGTSRGRLYQYK